MESKEVKLNSSNASVHSDSPCMHMMIGPSRAKAHTLPFLCTISLAALFDDDDGAIIAERKLV